LTSLTIFISSKCLHGVGRSNSAFFTYTLKK
jgi:hypothetical protein